MTTFNKKYEVIGKIGEGSFSVVLKCIEKTTGLHYAAKRLKKTFTEIDDVLCSAEVIATQVLAHHPNILNMLEYYYSPSSGNLVFIFDLMDMSLYEYLLKRRRCMPEIKVKNYLYQILKGLEHLHMNGLFHRDIKPENILMKVLEDNHYNVIKLADFGSIRGIYSEHPYTDYISTRWYRSPECLLTVGYYGPKMDIWATGCVFYEMLTTKPLFPGTNEIDQLSKIHTVLGTPSRRLLFKLKQKSYNFNYFPTAKGTGLTLKLPNIGDDAIKLLTLMLEYDPDRRINVRRLLDQKYFTIFRENDVYFKMSAPYVESIVKDSIQNRGDFRTKSSFYAKRNKSSKVNQFASKSCCYWHHHYHTFDSNTTNTLLLNPFANIDNNCNNNSSIVNCNHLSKSTVDKINDIISTNNCVNTKSDGPDCTSKTTSSLLNGIFSKLY